MAMANSSSPPNANEAAATAAMKAAESASLAAQEAHKAARIISNLLFSSSDDKDSSAIRSSSRRQNKSRTQIISIGICGIIVIATGTFLYIHNRRRRRRRRRRLRHFNNPSSSSAYESLIGNTPLIPLPNLSKLTHPLTIYAKLESSNPGGTPKDRVARAILQHHFKSKTTGGIVVEGTSGSTGISLAHLCRAQRRRLVLFLPDDQSDEKRRLLERLGAIVTVVPNCSISNPEHYVNRARRAAEELAGDGSDDDDDDDDDVVVLFANQFENEANWKAHYESTGPEIWEDVTIRRQTKIAGFVMGAGTGGTIAGVGMYLKRRDPSVEVMLVDPPGSVLYNKIKHGVAYVSEQSERSMLRHRYDTIAEGIGLDRITANVHVALEGGVIDDSVKVTDQEAVDMAHYLLKREGLFVGSSSAINVVGAVRLAQRLRAKRGDKGEEAAVVTIVCDGGYRHVTRFWNPDFVRDWGLIWPGDDDQDRVPQCIADLIKDTDY